MPAGIIRQWLRLSRLQAGAATSITCVFGAILLMPRDRLDMIHLFILFVIGLLFHFYGFVLNEYSDIEVDRYSKALSEKPLIKGTIKRRHALVAALIAIFIAFALAVIAFQSVFAVLALGAAVVLGAVYDLYGKRFFGADIVLGASIFFFCIFGALTVSTHLTSAVYLAAFLFFIQLSFQTGVTGGMKDIPHDHLAGAKTSPVFLGCRVMGKKLVVTRAFVTYVVAYKIIHTIAVLVPFGIDLIELPEPYLPQLTLLVILIVLMWLIAASAVTQKDFGRTRLMRKLGTHEIVTYPMVAILITGVIGIGSALFLVVFPIIWLAIFLYIIYGKFMPDV
jgi:4-hydroxybenzoate polyprenyltransferase